MSTPGRRRLHFSLRTLFVVMTVLGVVLGWVIYQLNWIRQRHSLLDQQELLADELERRLGIERFYSLPIHRPTAPGLLWLFGEEGHDNLSLNIVENDPKQPVDEAMQKQMASRLFPEAKHIEVNVIPDP